MVDAGPKYPLTGEVFTGPPQRSDILKGFETLIAGKKLFGAEINPEVLKKSGSKRSFLISKIPPKKKLMSIWAKITDNQFSPDSFFGMLSVTIGGFEHRENMLLFGRDRIIYNTQIFHEDRSIGEMTLFFYTLFDEAFGIWAYLKRKRLKVMYIDTIWLEKQSSGYASDLFRYYEKLFHDIGFHQFRLKASLSVGKYYWAKEGFDCLENAQLKKKKERMRALVLERNLPVRDAEINRLNHMYDFAGFKRDVAVPVYSNKDGYYSLDRDDHYPNVHYFPLGKAFLLTQDPWDGFKVIYTNTPRRTGFVYSSDYLLHRTRTGHPESPRRVEKVLKAINKNEIHRSLVFLDPYLPDREMLEKVHLPHYLDQFKQSVLQGESQFQTRDCSISRESYDAALLAVGGVMAGVDAVLNRRVENVFCMVRPPGHHAGSDYAMGFCFINNVAVGARYARKVYGVERIFILDWDVHHGNGTQDIFYEDDVTFFCSIHEHPTFCYPGTGRRMDRGKGKGSGFTLNVPLKPHSVDSEVVEAFEREVVPAIEGFRPELIMVSAGFDAHKDDPIAGLDLSELSFEYMTKRICEIADKHCEGRIVSVLEGGYNSASLTSSILAHLKTLQGRSELCMSGKG